MFKSYYLLKLLLIALILLCLHTRSFAISTGIKPGTIEVRTKLKQIFSSQLGVRERSGANDGTAVEQYLTYAGLKKGAPWCAAFVCWSLGKAGVANPRSGWSPSLFPSKKRIWLRGHFTSTGAFRSRSPEPSTGDVFGIFFPDKGRIAHCGFIETWGKTWVLTVEGNTNAAGSREGDGVYRKRRLKRSIYAVSSWIDSPSAPRPLSN